VTHRHHHDEDNSEIVFGYDEPTDKYYPLAVNHLGRLKSGLVKSSFGDLSVVNLTSLTDVEFSYILHPEIVNTRLNNGTASVDANRMKLSTGAGANQSAQLFTRVPVKYHAGIGALVRYSGVYTSGVDGSDSLLGVGDSGDGFFFGYNGPLFSILRRKGGNPEIRSLQITTKSTTAENITITLDGNADATVTVTDATATDATTTANEIAAHDFSNLGRGWTAVALGAIVNFISYDSSPRTGTYSLSGTTAVGTFSVKLSGVTPTDTWTAQTDWSEDTFDGNGPSGLTLDPTKGNVFQIRYQWLGFGQIRFYIEHSEDGEPHHVHSINYANTDTTPSINSPTLPLCGMVENTTNTTDMLLYSSSMGGFSEGVPPEPTVTHVHIVPITLTSETVVPIITLHNNGVFAGKINRIRMKITDISVEVESGKPIVIQVITGAELTGASFEDHSAGESVALFDISATAISNGETIKAFPVSTAFDKEKTVSIPVEPTEFLAIAGAQTTTGTNSVVKLIVTWSEDF